MTDLTSAHEMVEHLRWRAADRSHDPATRDAFDDAADMIERMADRINHLTNISEGKSEMIAELRAGLIELKAMLAPEQSA